jgi:hypothetical protein
MRGKGINKPIVVSLGGVEVEEASEYLFDHSGAGCGSNEARAAIHAGEKRNRSPVSSCPIRIHSPNRNT